MLKLAPDFSETCERTLEFLKEMSVGKDALVAERGQAVPGVR